MDVEEDENNNEDKEDNNDNDEIANFGREDGKRTELREKALETLGFLLELPREDMLPYFQEIGAALSVNLEAEQDLGKKDFTIGSGQLYEPFFHRYFDAMYQRLCRLYTLVLHKRRRRRVFKWHSNIR